MPKESDLSTPPPSTAAAPCASLPHPAERPGPSSRALKPLHTHPGAVTAMKKGRSQQWERLVQIIWQYPMTFELFRSTLTVIICSTLKRDSTLPSGWTATCITSSAQACSSQTAMEAACFLSMALIVSIHRLRRLPHRLSDRSRAPLWTAFLCIQTASDMSKAVRSNAATVRHRKIIWKTWRQGLRPRAPVSV